MEFRSEGVVLKDLALDGVNKSRTRFGQEPEDEALDMSPELLGKESEPLIL